MNQRKRVGRPYKFTPEEFKQAWDEYFGWCDNNPWIKHDVIRSGEKAGRPLQIQAQRPYTEVGFCSFHGLGEKYLTELGHTLEGKEDEESKELSNILSRAKAKCYAQKLEGAMVGVFNANIIARHLKLSDRVENAVMVEQPLFSDDADEGDD